MAIVIICLSVMFCAALLVGFQEGVPEYVKMKCPADLPANGMLFMYGTPVGDGGSGSPLPYDSRDEIRQEGNKPVSQISSSDLQTGENGSTMETGEHQDPVLSELKPENDNAPGPDSIFTVKSSKSDPLAKQIFSLKGVDAFLLKKIQMEYAQYSVGDIVELAIDSIAANTGFGETEHFPASQIEITSPEGAVVRVDVRFFAKHAPKAKIKVKKKPKSSGKRKKRKAGKSQQNQKINPLDIMLVHIEAQNADSLDQVLLNRSQLISAADLFGQLEPSGNQYRKYRNVSDVLVIWILFSKDPHQQNRILTRESDINVVFENNYQLLRKAKAGQLKSDSYNSGMVDNKDCNDVESFAKKIREEIGNASWPYKTRMQKSLVTEWFIILGDPNKDFVEKYSPLLHALDTIFWEDMDSDEKLRILREYGIVKSEKEAEVMSCSITGSPFLVSMGDLQRRVASMGQTITSLKRANASQDQTITSLKQANASQDQTIASLEERLATALKKIESLEQGKTEKGDP